MCTKQFLNQSALSLLLSTFFAIFGTTGVTRSSAQSVECDQSLWQHVYHAYRLPVYDSCTYAIGTVMDTISEEDGDWHLRVKVDPDWQYMINSGNTTYEYGYLVCEIICANQITQSDAVQPCQGYTNQVAVPNIGEHVKIVGSYVTDNVHNNYNEIHPITSITITTQTDSTPTGVNNITADDLAVSVFPSPASKFVSFKLDKIPSGTVFITITDGDGRSGGLFQMKSNPQFNVPVSNFPAGVYYYGVVMDNKLIKSGKFVVVH